MVHEKKYEFENESLWLGDKFWWRMAQISKFFVEPTG